MFHYVDDLIHAAFGQLVPRQVDELELCIHYAVEDILADRVGHITVIETQDFQHLVLAKHLYYALSHLLRQVVVAEVKCVQPFQKRNSLYDIVGLPLDNFEFFHLEVLNIAQRVTKQLLKDCNLIFANEHAINTEC